MITNDIIQAGILSKLKSLSAITALVGSEIREIFWQGTEFGFPAVRVDLSPTSPSIEGCNYSDIDFSIHVASESASSFQCSQIQGIIANSLPHSFRYVDGLDSYLFSGIRVRRGGLGPPVRIDERTWTNETMFQGIVSVG